MSQHLYHLKTTVRNLARRPVTAGPLTEDLLRAHGMARGQMRPDGIVGILADGIEAFERLCDAILDKKPRVERGTRYLTYQQELFSFLLSEYLEAEPDRIDAGDVAKVEAHIDEWFEQRTGQHLIPIPCFLSPAPSPRFLIGSVEFLFIEEVPKSAYYLDAAADALGLHDFDALLEQMRSERAHWLGVVEIEACDRERSQDLADLAVDLAIVAVQLAQPYLDTKTMSRLSNRRGAGMDITLSRSQGGYSAGRSSNIPGAAIGHGYLGKIVNDGKPIMDAVGARVRSFTTGVFRLPVIEQAWCDAAYWLREGLAERIDSIAVAKLETSLEVFLAAESSRGSEARLLEMM